MISDVCISINSYINVILIKESVYDFITRPLMRIKIIRLRKRFDDNKNIIDVQIVQKLLKEGKKELWTNQHYYPHQCK